MVATLTELLEDADDSASTEWEIQFVEDMKEKAENPFFTPTKRQLAKLAEIAGDDLEQR